MTKKITDEKAMTKEEIIDELHSKMKENSAFTAELFNHLRGCNMCRIKWSSMVEDVKKHIEETYQNLER